MSLLKLTSIETDAKALKENLNQSANKLQI
jgi:hypothetical protein